MARCAACAPAHIRAAPRALTAEGRRLEPKMEPRTQGLNKREILKVGEVGERREWQETDNLLGSER